MGEAEGSAQNLYDQGRDAVREAGEEASQYASELYENAGAYAQQGRKIMRQKVRESPLSMLLVAGLIGFVLGLSARGRN